MQDSDLCCKGDTGRTLGVLEDVRVSENSAQGVLTEPWHLIHSDTGSPEAYYRCVCVCVLGGGAGRGNAKPEGQVSWET